MQDVLAIPEGALAGACLTLAQTNERELIVEHSIRSFLFARLLAEHEGSLQDSAYDEDLLFFACVLHDLGLGTAAKGEARFEVEGADLAAALLTEWGMTAPDVDRVWEAIALHSSTGIADRLGLLTYLTHRGVMIDVGRDEVVLAGIQIVRAAYPRPANNSIAEAIVAHASRSPACAPPGSLAAELMSREQARKRK